MDITAAGLIREARTGAGLTQQALAERAGVTQSVISAYESGRRDPSFTTLKRLVNATGQRLNVGVLRGRQDGMLESVLERAAALHSALDPLGAVDIRVFGSVARGEESPASDVDLLVELAPATGLFALARMQTAAEELLGRPVDIVPADALKPDMRERVRLEAVPV